MNLDLGLLKQSKIVLGFAFVLFLSVLVYAAGNTINPDISFTLTSGYFVDGATYDSTTPVTINFSMNDTGTYRARVCNYTIYIHGTGNNMTMLESHGNLSTTNSSDYWTNATEFNLTAGGIAVESNYSAYHNFTLSCNFSGFNKSSPFKTQTYQFKIDTHYPHLTTYYNFTHFNTSTETHINMTFNITDINIDSCGVNYYMHDGVKHIKLGTVRAGTRSWGGGNQTVNCTVGLNNSELTMDGNVTLEYFVNDTYGHYTYSSANQTAITTIIKANKWNLITVTDFMRTYEDGFHDQNPYNVSSIYTRTTYLRHLGTLMPSVTSLAYFNNEQYNKNFTTYAKSTTNRLANVSLGSAVFVYSDADFAYTRRNVFAVDEAYNTSQGNVTLWEGAAGKTGWSLIGTIIDRTMYSTLYGDNCYNYTSSGYGSVNGAEFGADCANLTAISWYNASSGRFITCARGSTSCAGTSQNVSDITIRRGTGLFMLPSINMTYVRGQGGS